MKKLRWQLIIICITGLVVGILLLSEQPGARNPGGLLSPNNPPQGGSYTEALIGSLQRLNPLLDYYNSADRDIDRLVYSRLVTFDDSGLPQGDLAESWGVSQDGTVYNIALRPDVKWHDGEPLTAADVVFTVDMMRNGADVIPADLVSFWSEVEVEALSDTAVQFRLPEPFAPFVDYLSFGILPQHIFGQFSFAEMIDSPANLAPIGSGPYRFDRLIVENGQIMGVALQVNEGYYLDRPNIAEFIFRYYADSASALQAYQDDVVQGVASVSADALNAALAEPDLALYTGRKPELALVLFNLNNSEVDFFQNAIVRRALYAGLNRQFMVDRVLNGQAILADGVILPGTWAYHEGLGQVTYDPTTALQMLKEEDYILADENATVRSKEDKLLQFTLLYPDTVQHRAIAERIQADWESLNVGVILEAVPYDQLIQDRLASHNYQAALVDLNLSRSPDPDPYPFWDQVQATGGQNYAQWNNNMASEHLENARVAVDISERMRLYNNFQVIFTDELPALPLYYPVYTYAVRNDVQGVRMGPLFDSCDRFASVLDWYLVAPQEQLPAATATP
ncbi:MAG TPA: ABC transporter substrate-binding protein [Anaerolineaceae bacterium]|mgnify:FL=1|nr:ABC transporter substrate-binding protein [Anaerolineaceae bacterium]HQH84630.1 ABC transporter substrate-binding protein [Anaerolineaceae bacterium]